MNSPDKTQQKKKKRKTQQAQTKIENGNRKIEKTFFKQENQEEIKRSFFFSENKFSKEIVAKINCK